MAVKKILWSQWLACFVVSLAVLSTGLSNGWTSPFLSKLTIPEAHIPSSQSFKLTESEASWLASLLNLGRFIGVIVGAFLQGILGRKKTLLMGGLPIIIGWSCMIFSNSVSFLYTGRSLCGFASGVIWSAISLYIGEIADPSIRGSLILLLTNTASVGALLGNIIGPSLEIEEFAYVGLIIITIFILLFSLIPESPYFHVLNGDTKKAEASLKWYNSSSDITKELNDIKVFIGNDNLSIKEKFMEFNKPKNRKNMLSLVILNLILSVSGYNIMNYYSEIIIIKSKINLIPSNVVIALGFCTVIAGLTAVIFVDKFGRRSLLIFSSIGTSLSMIILALHFHLLTINFNPNSLTLLPIFGLFLFNFSIAYGMIPVPSALLGELFEHNSKTFASLFYTGSLAILSFLTTKTFQPVVDIIGEKFVFLIFGFMALSTAPFTYFFIPETGKGQTLLDIQKNMKSLKKQKKFINTVSREQLV